MLPGIGLVRVPCWQEIAESIPMTTATLCPPITLSGSCLYQAFRECLYSDLDGSYARGSHRQTVLAQGQRRVALLQEACAGTRISLPLPTAGNCLSAGAANRPARGSPTLP